MGPLEGIRVIELAGIGPAPFCAMLLSDMGAEVLRIERPEAGDDRTALTALNRGRRSVALDLKKPAGCEALLRIVEGGDALIEGFRPGVMERLGLSPDACLARNPRLVYGRMTGWGQDGPLAPAPGHDLNYIALAGVLATIGPAERPVPPLNLIGDFGGGAMFLAFGVVCALLEVKRSGKGQVVDAAMVDGAAALMTPIYGLYAQGEWKNSRASNFLDGAAPFYGTYECSDGKWIAVAAIEDRFYRDLVRRLSPDDSSFEEQWDRSRWAQRRERLAAIFRSQTRARWCELLEGTDACVSPVLDLDEAPRHPHARARQTFRELGGFRQPAPAPRFSRTVPEWRQTPPATTDPVTVLREWGVGEEEIDRLTREGAIGRKSSARGG